MVPEDPSAKQQHSSQRHPLRMDFLQGVIDAIPVPVFFKDLQGRYLGCNASFERFAGMSRSKIIGKTVYDILPKKTADLHHAKESELIEKGGFQSYESQIPFADTTMHEVAIHREPFFDERGEMAGVVGAIFDITERKKLQERLKDCSAELDIRLAVRTAELSKANDELLKKISDYKRTENELKSAVVHCKALADEHVRKEEALTSHMRLLEKENRRFRNRLLTDSPTGVYNRVYVMRRIEHELSRARRFSAPLAVMVLEADHFTAVEEVYGASSARSITRQYAQLIRKAVRRYDVIARWSDDRFVILCWGLKRQAAMELAERLCGVLNGYAFGNRKQRIRLRSHIAVAVYPEDKAERGMDLLLAAERVLRACCDPQINVCSTSDGRKSKAAHREETALLNELCRKIEALSVRSHKQIAQVLMSFAKNTSAKDAYPPAEVVKSVKRAVAVGRFLGFSRDRLAGLREAMLLRDIGKAAVPAKILAKKKGLTPREFEVVCRHPQIGADILRPLPRLGALAGSVFYHHERWDGKGYPTGAKGEEIPLESRIIGLLEAYQALTNPRPYRKAFSEQKAISMIKKGAGSRFDPRVVCAFLEAMRSAVL